MRSLLACVVFSVACLHGYHAFPADSTSSTSSTATAATGTPPKDDKLSARFGTYDDKPTLLPAVTTKLLGGSDLSPAASVPLSSHTPYSSSFSSSFATSSSDSGRTPNAPHYEFPNARPDSRPCTCCKPSCGGAIQGPGFPHPLPFPGFNGGPYQGFNGGPFSGSKSSSSSFANQNFGGGYFPPGGYGGGFPLQPNPIYPSGSGSSASSSSFANGYQGVPGLIDGPFGGNFPVRQGSSSSSSASSSSSTGNGGSSSWSSSQSSSSSGVKTPVRPVYPPQEVTPEFSIPDAECRSSIGC